MKNFLPSVSFLVIAASALPAAAAATDTTYWIEPCSVMIAACQASDADLARWALQAWETASGGRLHFVETKNRADALLRVLWADKNSGLYGEAVSVFVNGHRASDLHILIPEPNGPDQTSNHTMDPLLRDTIVYLTCLHESGHALGLRHTRAFADIMYSFQFGGDIDEYFGRYRRKLTTREDIRKNPGMSAADRAALLERITETVRR